MYLEMEQSLGDDGGITLVCDTDLKSASKITLTLVGRTGQTVVEQIEPVKLGQFLVNAKRLLTMAHEDDVLSDEDDDCEYEEDD